MTITAIGAGTDAFGVNASVTPGFHASTAADDVVLIHASIRNSGTGSVDLPSGWTSLLYSGNHRLMARVFRTGDVPPTVTFTAGGAGDDTMAQAFTFRGMSHDMATLVHVSNTLLNGSAQDILYPASTVTLARCVALVLGWKQDDCSAVSTPAGFTSMGLAFTTTGNDASQCWRYQIQTTATNVSAGTLTVTGGAAAISRGVSLALKPARITTSLQVEYPPRVLVSVIDLTLTDVVSVYRVVSGVRTLLRKGFTASATDVSFLVLDAELPFGVPVSYIATINGVDYLTASTTYSLAGGRVVLSDAVGGQSAEVIILAWPEKAYDRRSSEFIVGGRNVVVSGDFAGYRGTLDLFLSTTSSYDNVAALLDGATSGIIQIRQPGGYDGVDSYVVVRGWRGRRFSQDGSDQRRIISLDAVEVEAWASTLEARGYTLQDVANAYTGLTLTNLAADYTSLLKLAQASF